MKAYVVFECDVPNEDISESLDFHVGALDILREALINNANPCAYGLAINVLTETEYLRRK